MLISPIKFNNNFVYGSLQNQQSANVKLGSRLIQDTVSFSGGAKYLTERTKEVSYKLASDINEEAQPHLRKLLGNLKRYLKNLIETDTHPDNPIMSGSAGIHGRVKSPESIIEKALKRGKRTKAEIENMGDVIGARVTLRSSSQSDVHSVFAALEEMIKKEGYKVLEVENYRPTPNDSYISQKTLNKFEEFCTKLGMYPKIKNEPIENGYSAIHLTLEKNGRVMELQIMGRDVEIIKDVEDFYYKYRCNTPFVKKYKPIQKIFDEDMPKLEKIELGPETLLKYQKDSYARAKNLESRPSRKKLSTKEFFLPFPYYLPQRLSYENLYKEIEKCNNAVKSKV